MPISCESPSRSGGRQEIALRRRSSPSLSVRISACPDAPTPRRGSCDQSCIRQLRGTPCRERNPHLFQRAAKSFCDEADNELLARLLLCAVSRRGRVGFGQISHSLVVSSRSSQDVQRPSTAGSRELVLDARSRRHGRRECLLVHQLTAFDARVLDPVASVVLPFVVPDQPDLIVPAAATGQALAVELVLPDQCLGRCRRVLRGVRWHRTPSATSTRART
jgi:hypothetical protein